MKNIGRYFGRNRYHIGRFIGHIGYRSSTTKMTEMTIITEKTIITEMTENDRNDILWQKITEMTKIDRK